MTDSRILLVDSEEHTARLLSVELGVRGFGAVTVASDAVSLTPFLASGEVDVVIVNHRYEEAGTLAACNIARRVAPDCATIVITAPGPALHAVRAWARHSLGIDLIVEKPFSDDRFYRGLADLLTVRATARSSRSQAERLASLVPAGAMLAAAELAEPEAELFDAAVLFTDIRDSSRLVTQMAPREYFDLLNQVLSEQSAHIHAGQGSVVKYTGDGTMAIFRGMGRSYLALRCGLQLAATSSRQALPFGVGIAHGLVLAGLIGDASRTGQRRQFDVIGATAHLAARLCARAGPGQVVVTSGINAVAQVRQPMPQPFEQMSIRGFSSPVDCVTFTPEPA